MSIFEETGDWGIHKSSEDKWSSLSIGSIKFLNLPNPYLTGFFNSNKMDDEDVLLGYKHISSDHREIFKVYLWGSTKDLRVCIDLTTLNLVLLELEEILNVVSWEHAKSLWGQSKWLRGHISG